MSSDIPSDLRYTKSHEWVRVDADDVICVGITDHAQEHMGDLVYVEVPEVGDSFASGDACAVVESVKAASDIYAPVAGKVVEVNEALADAPEAVNEDPYHSGWIFSLQVDDMGELEKLLDADAYAADLDSDA